MEVKNNYSPGNRVMDDPNLQMILEHVDRLLNEDHVFESPFRCDKDKAPEVDACVFDVNTDEVDSSDEFDLQDKLPDFIGKIREKDTTKSKRGFLIGIGIGVALLFILVGIFFLWSSSKLCTRKYTDGYEITYTQAAQMGELEYNNEIFNSFNNNIESHANSDKEKFVQNLQIIQDLVFKNHLKLDDDKRNNNTNTVQVHSFEWLIILCGGFISLAFLAIIIVLVFRVCKKDGPLCEESRLLLEHQNKMINEYASYLYSVKRMKLQKVEAEMSFKQQYALQQLDYRQKAIECMQKEQELAWKYKQDHLKLVENYLAKFEYCLNPPTERETSKEEKCQSKTGKTEKEPIIYNIK